MTTNKILSWRKISAALALTFALVAPTASTAEESISLSFATYYPGTASWADVEIAYMKKVEELSNGRVKFDPINWKGLFGAKELQGALADGAIDTAWSSSMYTPADNPLRVLLIGGPFLATTVASQSQCSNYLYENWEPYRDDFHKNGIHLLYTRPGPAMNMITGEMISGPKDLIGKKIRAHGKAFSAGMANLGAIPVLVEAFDVEQQLRAGNIAASSETGGTGSAKIANNIGGTATLVDPGIGPYGAGHMVMSLDKYNSLPEDVQQLLDGMRYHWTNVAIQNVYADYAAMMKMVEDNGINYMKFTEAQTAELRELMDIDNELLKLAAEYDAQGFPATEALERHKQCSSIIDKVNPVPGNGASDVHNAAVTGLSQGEAYVATAAELGLD